MSFKTNNQHIFFHFTVIMLHTVVTCVNTYFIIRNSIFLRIYYIEVGAYLLNYTRVHHWKQENCNHPGLDLARAQFVLFFHDIQDDT